jgi:hypothetical protein
MEMHLFEIDFKAPGYLERMGVRQGWSHIQTLPLQMSFVTEMPHGQRSGSFCPTHDLWFKGILY